MRSRRRRENTTNSYKNCELFTGIVVVVVLAAFALDAQSLLFPVVVVVVIAALHFRFRFAASYSSSSRKALAETARAGQRRRIVCCQRQLQRRRQRCVGLVVCFVFFANIKSIFLARIICRLTRPRAEPLHIKPPQILSKQKSQAASLHELLGHLQGPSVRSTPPSLAI